MSKEDDMALDRFPPGRRCRECQTPLPLSEFENDRRTTAGLGRDCRACRAERVRERMAKSRRQRNYRRAIAVLGFSWWEVEQRAWVRTRTGWRADAMRLRSPDGRFLPIKQLLDNVR